MAPRTWQAYGRVKSVSPLTVLVDGSTGPVAATNFGALGLSVGHRVLVQMFPAPALPQILTVLGPATPTGGDTLINAGKAFALAAVQFDIADVITANLAGDPFNPTGWVLAFGDPAVVAVPDDGGMTVDFSAYTGGSLVVLETIIEVSATETDKPFDVIVSNGTLSGGLASPVGGRIAVLPGIDNSALGVFVQGGVIGMSAASQAGSGYAVPFPTVVAVTDPSATVTSGTGTVVIEFALGALIPGSVYVDTV